ncbi:ATP-dependent helicase [Vagococcus fluvialis]|uniref:UvrD-helicase domain-containing protein n=1 Tax=Vagococcus fluvialis TaxID=2738 RepID=UPI00143302B0|nr:UvrD-helicase domain-containing protein [Vagococcus fluvialis]NKC59077.1 ATP-dependent helicase [Vagococcus fluvialis]NKD49832.1 ATP-dependent helicase [Vagococcus fluvialis]
MSILDQGIRDQIMDTEGSVMVSASAGSGKTTIMVSKIAKVLSETNNHKTVAALTFTNKATSEIKRKAIKENIEKQIVVLTNDSFVENEIIRPFIRDAYGAAYDKDFVISYNDKVNTMMEALRKLKTEKKLVTYRNSNKNLKFELAKKILEKSQACREYISFKYKMLFLDEYQDSDIDMHNLFIYMKDTLGLDLFIVGDKKQAIYLWRGAQENIFSLLEDNIENRFELTHNFRSHFEIVNYSNLIHDIGNFKKDYVATENRVLVCSTYDDIESIVRLIEQDVIDISKSVTIISNFNDDAKFISDELNNLGYKFVFIPKTPLDDGSANSHALKAIASFILDDNYYTYDLIDILGLESTNRNKKKLDKILNPIKELLQTPKTKEILKLPVKDVFKKFNKEFQFEIDDTEINLFIDAIYNPYFKASFINTSELLKVMTVFSSKGLEFNQIISFTKYYSDFSNINQMNNHYVCVTRAENKVIMLESPEKEYSKKINQIIFENNLSIENNIFTEIDHV